MVSAFAPVGSPARSMQGLTCPQAVQVLGLKQYQLSYPGIQVRPPALSSGYTNLALRCAHYKELNQWQSLMEPSTYA